MKLPRPTTLRGLPVLGVLALAVLGSAHAQEGDPPGRVAQLSYVQGAVSLEPAGLQEWTAAERNRPLTTGDRLWTDQESVAELDLGDAVLRLGGMTGFAFLNLDDRFAQIQLSTGTLIVSVRDTSGGQSYEIDTPNLALSLQQPGIYRVEVDAPGNTTLIKVSEGQALALGSGETIPIAAPQVMVFSGSTTLSYSAASLGPPDDLDTWSATRDNQEEESPSRQYVADDVPGSDELDDNGRWQSTPDYGYVWTPAVVTAAWVPYRFGHWVWVAPWGWTWVDDAPWGYATSHYGRWAFWRGSWCWVPGPRPLRPVYAPALVAWAHGPGFVPAGAGVANVGWFPLGPHEVYAPGYRVSDAYVRNVNLTGTTFASNASITDVYHNRATRLRYANVATAAITQVPQAVFTTSQRVGRHTQPVSDGTLTGMTVAATAPAVAPLRESVLGASTGGTGRKVAHPPPALANRAVVARAAPPRPPASFEAQLAAIQTNGNRPLARSDLTRLQPGTATAPVHLLASTSGAPQPGLAERARTLASPSLPPATTTRTFVYDPSPAAAAVSSGSNRPSWATQRALPPDHPSHAAPPPPPYQPDPPVAPAAVAPARTTRAAPSAPPAHPQQQQQRASTSKHADNSQKQSREDSRAHADASRNRNDH